MDRIVLRYIYRVAICAIADNGELYSHPREHTTHTIDIDTDQEDRVEGCLSGLCLCVLISIIMDLWTRTQNARFHRDSVSYIHHLLLTAQFPFVRVLSLDGIFDFALA